MKKIRLISSCCRAVCGIGLAFMPVLVQAQQVETPLMGWSSWNTYRVNINEGLIRKQADAMAASGLKEVGYRFINIDDGFFGYRDETGRLHTHPQRFPNGMKGIVDYIHSLGFKAGTYSDAGSNTCGSIWDHDVNGINVGLYGHERQDADLMFNEWGFDFIKIDYCGAGQELALEEQKRYTEICKAIEEVARHKVSVNICRWAYPGTWVKEIARSWRISSDITPNWWSVRDIIRKNLYLSAYTGGGHYNDMDMLEIGRGLKPEEEEVHFGMWCIMSSPLLIGCDMTTIPAASLELLKNKELIALNQDPLGLQAYVIQHEGNGYVLVKDIEQKRGTARAVALYNPSDTLCHFSVPASVLELGGKLKVRDLVKHRSEGTLKGALVYTLPAHSVKILRVEGETRLEPTVYEAEWAYLPCFNDLAKHPKTVAYTPVEGASEGMTVSYVGGSTENYAEWSEVYSEKGGQYEMTVSYVPGKYRKLEVEVNGKKTLLTDLETDTEKGISRITLPVTLNAGYNVVRMGSAYCWAPDIDCFTLCRIGK